MLNKNCSPWPSYTTEEIEAVSKVMLSNKVNYWTGDECRNFEKEFATFANAKYAVALANGTLAIDLALIALDIGLGDEVIVTSRTFLASASCIVNAGAIPIFADVDLGSQNITADTIKEKLTSKTKAILCVHLFGWPCDMDPIMTFAKEHDLYVIEDCAQAHGSRYKGKSVGSIGDIGSWSFCQDKIMTTGGEGGMVTTNDEKLWNKMWAYKDHGKNYDSVYNKEHPAGFRWIHDSFGSNFRMMEIQAAIGRIQLVKLNEWLSKRKHNARMISETCCRLPCFRVPQIPTEIKHAYYKLCLFVDLSKMRTNWTRDRLIKEINDLGTPCLQGSCSEIYLEKAFDNTSFRPKQRLENAKLLGETSITFLVHPTLTEIEIEEFCKNIKKAAVRAQK